MKNAEITKELEPAGIDRVHGVTSDGKHVWFAADDGDLIQADADTGAAVSKTAFGARAGITFDGEAIWAICGKEIKRIDPHTRAVLRTIPTPPGQVAGLAWAEGTLWIGLHGEKKILKVDPTNGRVMKTIALDRLVTGVTWAEGELWHGTIGTAQGAGGLHRIDAETGKELEELRFPKQEGASGIEYDPGRGVFFCGSHDGDTSKRTKIRAVKKP